MRLYMNGTFYILIVYYQACTEVQLIISFEIFKAMLPGKNNLQLRLFHCLRKGTILLV